MPQVEQETFTQSASENRLALVIGVNRAPHAQTPTLQNELKATEDAEAMAQVLTGPHCRFNLIRPPLLGEVATSAEVKKAILDLASHCEPGDFLLLYFAGHGYPMRVDDDLSDVFLVTDDFNEYQAQRDATLHLSMSWIREQLYEFWENDTGKAAGKVLLIFDCCKAGNFGRGGEDPYLEELKARINEYFDVPSKKSGFPPGRLRQALASTGHEQDAGEQNGHGRMTALLLDVLRGEVEETIDLQDYGKVKLWLVLNYLQRVMPEAQKPSLSGGDAGKLCVLAQYAERAEAIRQRNRIIVRDRPNTYLPFRLSTPMQARPDELQAVARLLTTQPESTASSVQGPVVGLLGMGGIGKSQLAREVAYDCKDAHRFPAGILWLTITGSDREALQRDLASLCEMAEYRPPDDDVLDPGNEGRRARHLCRYLAQHSDALLILDNVDNIDRLVTEELPFFAGEALRCPILYTSRISPPPSYVKPYYVQKLSEKDACSLLLTYRSAELRQIQDNPQGQLAQDVRAIYEYVERLPLALTLLRDLLRDDHLTLAHLRAELRRRGTLDITRGHEEPIEARLFKTFEQSWKRVPSAAARRLFQLAASFPEAAPIPLWLLGLVSDLPGLTVLEPLGQAREELYTLSLIEKSPDGEAIRVHPLIREFGQTLNRSDPLYARLQADAHTRLIGEFAHINKLEQRARAKGYWNCLSDVQVALRYAQTLSLDRHQTRQLERVAYWLTRDSDLLANANLWPQELPALFYQQLSNRLFEEDYQLDGTPPSSPWVRQLNHVGAGDQLLLQELRHPNEVMSVAFSPDGRKVLTGCADAVARLWNVTSGQVLQEFVGHTADIMGVAFSPDGVRIATCSRDMTARLWDATSGREINRFQDHDAAVLRIAFSPDGTRIATVSEDTTARVWDLAEDEMKYFAYHRGPVSDVAFSPDGKHIATCSYDGTALLWDIEDERPVASAKFENQKLLDSICFDPHGEYIVVGGMQKRFFWKFKEQPHQTLYPFRNLEADSEPFAVDNVAISDNRQYMAFSVHEGRMRLDTVQVWQLEPEKLWCSYTHQEAISDIAFSPDSRLVASASFDHTVRIWTIPPSPISQASNVDDGMVNQMAFFPGGKRVALGRQQGAVHIWDVNTETLSQHIRIEREFPWLMSLALSPDGETLAVGAFKDVVLWDVRKNEQIEVLSFYQGASYEEMAASSTGMLEGMAFSPDGRRLFIASEGEPVRVWDQHAREVVARFPTLQSDVSAIRFSPDGSRMVTSSMDGSIVIWDARSYTKLSTLTGHIGLVRSMCVSPDGALIASGGRDGTVLLWSLRDGSLIGSLKRRNQPVTALAFSPNSRFLVSCDLLGQVLFWSLRREASTLIPSLAAWYVAPLEIGAVHWGEPRSVLLADTGGTDAHPHFYHLALEVPWISQP